MATVLIVDDHPDVCRVVSRLVRTTGHDSVVAPGGGAALAFLAETIPDLVILDAMMPFIDGMEVLTSIRRDPRTQTIPVVMYSALSDPETRRRALELGASAYWVKGNFNLDQFDKDLSAFLAPPALQRN